MKYLKEYIDWEEDWEEEDENDLYKDYPKNFKKFLIEHDALEKYHRNILKYGLSPLWRNGNLKYFFKNIPRVCWISDSFAWEKSEGDKYWSMLDDLWYNS